MRWLKKPPPLTRLDPTNPFSRNCFGAYLLGEGAGTKVFNSAPFNLLGTLTNFNTATAWADVGPYGRTLTFDATNDYIDIGNHPNFHGTHKPLSIFARMKKGASGTNGGILGFRNGGGGWVFYVRTDESLSWFNGATERTGTAGAVPIGSWFTAGVSNDSAGNLSFYVNGVPAGTNTGGSITANTGNTIIGAWDAGASGAPGGQLEDVRYWIRRALSPSEFRRLHDEPFVGYEARPVNVGLSSEVSSEVELAIEEDEALPLGVARSVNVDQGLEEDEALGVESLRSVNLDQAIEVDEAPGVTSLKIEAWPIDDFCPRHLGIYPCAAPIGGGVAMTGKEPTIASGNGYWRIELGGFYVKSRELILLWRALESRFEGRGRSILVPFFDGKRAPWVTVGGPITATANAAVAQGATAIVINASSAGQLYVGQHFSAGHWGYRIIEIVSQVGNIYTASIFPKTREAIASGEALEFARPVVRCRLESDDGMRLPLHLLKRGEATVTFIEDVP